LRRTQSLGGGPGERDPQPVREFRTFTAELGRLADWLAQCRIKTVAMESTGVYWIPLYEMPEERGFQVVLVHARDVHNVPGRKSDVQDCEWLRELHSVGLLRPSFRPRADIVRLRCYLRQRETLVEEASARILRMQQALTQMNLMLHVVVTDSTGATGLKIMRSILKGERDSVQLATHRDCRCHASPSEIIAALTGNYREEHLFALRQNLAAYEFNLQQIAECDTASQALVDTLAAQPPRRRRRDPPAHRRNTSRASTFAPRSIGSLAALTSLKSTRLARTPLCNCWARSAPLGAAGKLTSTLPPGWRWRPTTKSPVDACSVPGLRPPPIARR
jgi:transposase